MPVAAVQSKAFIGTGGAWAGSFSSNVTPGNTVFLWAYAYNGATGVSNTPAFNGVDQTATATRLVSQLATSGGVYGTIWMMPNLPGGAAGVSLSNGGVGTIDANVGMVAVEVSGLGAAPSLDPTSPNPAVAFSTTGALASGSTGATGAAPEFIFGLGVAYGQNLTNVGAPWTELQADNGGSGFCLAAWQVAVAPGGTYSYGPASAGTANWVAAAGAVKPAAPAAPAIVAVPNVPDDRSRRYLLKRRILSL